MLAGNRVLRLQRFVSYTTNHAIDNEWGSRPLGVTCAPVTPTMAALSANLALCLEECIATVSPLGAKKYTSPHKSGAFWLSPSNQDRTL